MLTYNGDAAELLAIGQSVLVAVRPPQAVEQRLSDAATFIRPRMRSDEQRHQPERSDRLVVLVGQC